MDGLIATGVDVIHCSVFFHLFPLEEQIEAAKIVARVVRKGGVVVGRQSGNVKPGKMPAIKHGSTSFRHDVETSIYGVGLDRRLGQSGRLKVFLIKLEFRL